MIENWATKGQLRLYFGDIISNRIHMLFISCPLIRLNISYELLFCFAIQIYFHEQFCISYLGSGSINTKISLTFNP